MLAISDALRELDHALRGATDDRILQLRRVADAVAAVSPNPISPTREVLNRIGDRWSALLLSVLSTGSYRHNELQRVVDVLARLAQDSGISERMLTLMLRVLERDGLVKRCVGTGNAPAVEYTLTPLGASLEEKTRALIDWATTHTEAMREAQRAFDERGTLPADTRRHRLR